jgi:hypothetical protein
VVGIIEAAMMRVVILEPRIDEMEPSGEPRFKTHREYELARELWIRAEALREFQETATKSGKLNPEEFKKIEEMIKTAHGVKSLS